MTSVILCSYLLAAMVPAAVSTASTASSVSITSTTPRDWTPEVFDYDRPGRLEVTDRGVPSSELNDTRQFELSFKNLRDEEVPVLVTLPPTGKGPFPAVLLIHALGSDRQQITQSIARVLTARGFACVALDLPKHGQRGNKAEELFFPNDPEKTYQNMVAMVKDIRQTIDLIKERKEFDTDQGVAVVGYSLGAWLATLTGAADRRVSSMVLQGGGIGVVTETTKDRSKWFKVDRNLLDRRPTLRPQVAIPYFSPRPILMQNGKKDSFIKQENARELYRQAKMPKEIRFYDCGHIFPVEAQQEAGDWLKKLWDKGRPTTKAASQVAN